MSHPGLNLGWDLKLYQIDARVQDKIDFHGH
jgi:hypothetical protein